MRLLSNSLVSVAGGGITLPSAPEAGETPIYVRYNASGYNTTTTYKDTLYGYAFYAVSSGTYRVRYALHSMVTDTGTSNYMKLTKNGTDVSASEISTGEKNITHKIIDVTLSAGDIIRLQHRGTGVGTAKPAIPYFTVAILANKLQGAYGKIVAPTLELASWDDINQAAVTGKAQDYWTIGDTKTITFQSSVFGSTSITVKILDFSYDDLASGGKAAITFGMTNCFSTKQSMNATNTNVGGWGECALRSSLISDVLPALESALGSGVIKSVNKRTSAGNQSSTINTTADKIWLLSEFELWQSYSNSVAGEKPTDKSVYYAELPLLSRTRAVDGTNSIWWCRSPVAANSTSFCTIAAGGTGSTQSASLTHGVSIGFCV